MKSLTLASLAAFVALATGCSTLGIKPPPDPNAMVSRTTNAAVPSAPTTPSVLQSKDATPATTPAKSAASVPTTVEVHSDCAKTVEVFYGDKPKFGSGTKSSVSSNSTSSQGRNADGTLTIWIIDDKENGLASAKVTATTKRVTIDSTCKGITTAQ